MVNFLKDTLLPCLMSDGNYEENQMKLHHAEFLRSISNVSPKIKNSLDERNKQVVCELLTQLFVDNLHTYGKIRSLLGYNADRLNQEEIDNIHNNILSLIK